MNHDYGYKVLVSDSAARLSKLVVTHLPEGWSCQGGVNVLYIAGSGFQYSQAMILEEMSL